MVHLGRQLQLRKQCVASGVKLLMAEGRVTAPLLVEDQQLEDLEVELLGGDRQQQ